MEVKSVYMDLQEGRKKGNVWKLESEAFKKPIEIKIWYENKELKQFEDKVDELKRELRHNDDYHDALTKEINKVKDTVDSIGEVTSIYGDETRNLNDKVESQKKETAQLYKVIADMKTTIETLSGTILHLQEQTKQISQKVTKQPTVIHDKCFISWRESCGVGMINLPDGEYLMIAKYIVWEHNEYVLNREDLIIDKISVEGQHYIPFYKLEWGTELDTPTATIYYDLAFIPI